MRLQRVRHNWVTELSWADGSSIFSFLRNYQTAFLNFILRYSCCPCTICWVISYWVHTVSLLFLNVAYGRPWADPACLPGPIFHTTLSLGTAWFQKTWRFGHLAISDLRAFTYVVPSSLKCPPSICHLTSSSDHQNNLSLFCENFTEHRFLWHFSCFLQIRF